MSKFGHRRLSLLAVAAAAAGALLGGCSSSGDPQPSAATTDPVAWMDQFCTASVNIQPTGVTSVSRISRVGLAEAKKSLTEFARVYDEAIPALDKLGKSPVKGGDEFVAELRSVINKVRPIVAAAKDKIAPLQDNDPAVTPALKAIEADFKAATADVGKGLDDSELKAKAAGVPSCQKAGLAPSASAPTPSR